MHFLGRNHSSATTHFRRLFVLPTPRHGATPVAAIICRDRRYWVDRSAKRSQDLTLCLLAISFGAC
jgi:hypothetical protein